MASYAIYLYVYTVSCLSYIRCISYTYILLQLYLQYINNKSVILLLKCLDRKTFVGSVSFKNIKRIFMTKVDQSIMQFAHCVRNFYTQIQSGPVLLFFLFFSVLCYSCILKEMLVSFLLLQNWSAFGTENFAAGHFRRT